jgi:hypothetical protein
MEYLRMKELRIAYFKSESNRETQQISKECSREGVRCVILMDDDALHFTQNECMLLQHED